MPLTQVNLLKMSGVISTESSADATSNKESQMRRPRFTTVTEEEYGLYFWPKLEGAILLILKQNPGQFIPISYEEMYSTVYKCVCQQHADKMYRSLTELVSSYLRGVATDLQNTQLDSYLVKFEFLLAQYLQAVTGIVAIFNYMNRFYIIPKLHTDLKVELWKLFTAQVADNPVLFEIIQNVSSRPFAISPQTMMSVIKGLYTLHPEFAERNPELFARFIPNVLPATQPQDLPIIIEQTQELQQRLVTNEGYSRDDFGRKRRGEDSQGR